MVGMLNGTTTLSTTFLLTDSLGSVVSSFSNIAGSAKVLGNQLYGPYGNQRYKQGDIATDKGYTGQYHDSLTGLNYYVARYYDPVIGAFISADTIEGNPQGMNPYAYVGGNPETMSDPTGHEKVASGGGSHRSFNSRVYQLLTREGISRRGLPYLLDAFLFNPRLWAFAEVFAQYELQDTTRVMLGAQAYELKHNSGINWNANVESMSLFIKLGGLEIPYIQALTAEPGDNPKGAALLANIGFAKALAAPSVQAIKRNPNVLKGATCSFTPSTLGSTDQGERAIGTLQTNDQVWAYNQETQKMELQPVTHVWINQDDDLVDLTLTTTKPSSEGKSETQESEVLHTNKKHPFLTVEKGFVPVGELVLGMHVIRADGSIGVVSGWQVVPGKQKMYNLTVAQVHTFTVGEGQWVVHNDCGNPTVRASIYEALASADPATKLEGVAARTAMSHSKVTGFQAKYGPGGSIGENDVETTVALIEVTTQANFRHKYSQIQTKLGGHPVLNPKNLPIIVFAPGVPDKLAKRIESLGVYYARTEYDLMIWLQLFNP